MLPFAACCLMPNSSFLIPHSSLSEAPSVSVVALCHNHAPFLREALDSILGQTYPDFRLVLVDDGSGDDTEETCRAKGGTFRPVCLMGLKACVVNYADGGKPCTGKAQCEGQCRLEGPPPMPGATATGVCQRTSDPCGCFTMVEDGKVQAAICVD